MPAGSPVVGERELDPVLSWRDCIARLDNAPFLPVETAEYAVKSMNPIASGTIFFAILTGVILWLSSLAGGWIENWAVYHQLPRAIAEHRFGAAFKPDTMQKFSEAFARNVAPWGGSIVLGFMLGMTPSVGHFFGLPLDVRHVTLSTGTLALGVTSRGPEVLGKGALIWAALGIAVTFVMTVSTCSHNSWVRCGSPNSSPIRPR